MMRFWFLARGLLELLFVVSLAMLVLLSPLRALLGQRPAPLIVMLVLLIVVLTALLVVDQIYPRAVTAKMIRRGKAKTLQQYLVVFPEACDLCGSRTVDIQSEERDHTSYDMGGGRGNTWIVLVRRCVRCGNKNEAVSRLRRHSVLIGDNLFRVYSPYLSVQAADSIRDWD